jgi:hypothetical protein
VYRPDLYQRPPGSISFMPAVAAPLAAFTFTMCAFYFGRLIGTHNRENISEEAKQHEIQVGRMARSVSKNSGFSSHHLQELMRKLPTHAQGTN